jgi:molybdopterin/thiamine biosynthesis adenylyltransferase
MDILKNIGLNINGNTLYGHKNNPIGFLNPGILISRRKKTLILVGPLRTAITSLKAPDVIQGLWKSGCLIKCNTSSLKYTINKLKDPRYSRTTAFLLNYINDLDEVKKFYLRISKVRIGVFGCGGIGSNLSFLLSGMGFKKLLLIDNDRIEESNLNRQTLYSRRDIGLYKIDVLYSRILERFPECRIQKINQLVKVKNVNRIMKNVDFLIISADNPSNLFTLIQDIALSNKKILMSAGYSMGVGKIFMVNGKIIHFDKFKWETPEIDISSSSGPLNYEVSALAATVVLKFYMGKLNKSIVRYEWDSFEIPRRNIDWG